MLTVEEALQHILSDESLKQQQRTRIETVNLLNACGRVLAEDQIATIDVPPWDNSAMDGYAVCVADIAKNNSLPVSQIVPAGKYPQPLQQGTAARIFTGAPIPQGVDAVEMQENTQTENDRVVFLQTIKTGANIRRRGEDIAKQSIVVKAGTLLKPAHLGLLASVGIKQIPAHKQLRVIVVSTGDELVEPGEPLKDGQIYNSNRYLLLSLLQEMACDVIDGGIIGDNLELTKKRLGDLATQGDVIVSSGGVSVGEEDHVKAAVETIGKLNLWKIAVKPGKPLAFGAITQQGNHTTFFGLPGNPVSAFVTFLLFVKPYLLKAQGVANVQPQLIEAIADFDWPAVKMNKEHKALTREEYLRARLREDGRTVEIYPNQSSAALSSVVWANGLAIAPIDSMINRGDKIKFLPI